MHAPKAPPSSLAALRPCLVPRTSHRRAPVAATVAGQGVVRHAVGGLPQGRRGGVDLGHPFLVLRYGCQSAARAAKVKARA